MSHRVLQLGDVEPLQAGGAGAWLPLRRLLGATGSGSTATRRSPPTAPATTTKRWRSRRPDSPTTPVLPGLNYQLACYHALAGRREEATRHFERAYAADPRVAGWAAGDEDLDLIRDSLPRP